MKQVPSLVWFRLRWPRSVEATHLTAAMRSIYGVAGLPVVLETCGSNGRIRHHIGLPPVRSRDLSRQLRTAIPGLELGELRDTRIGTFDLVLELKLTSARRPLAASAHPVTSGLLTALGSAGPEETVVLRWQLVDRVEHKAVPSKVRLSDESLLKAIASVPFGLPPPLDAEARSALKTKRSEPGWRAVGRIAVSAASDARSAALAQHVLGALRVAEAPGVRLAARRTSRSSLAIRGRGGSTLNVLELPLVAGWPVGETSAYRLERMRSRQLPVSEAVPARGRVIAEATGSNGRRPVALSVSDSLRHLHVLGPTGVGKSTLLLNLAVQDIRAGRSVVVIEPKGDLIADVLARVPGSRLDDVVLLDPTDRQAVVGLNPLAEAKHSPELAADHLLAVFRGLYAASWGPRTQDILHASLLTLARRPGSTLVELPLLLNDPAFRRQIVGKLDEPVVLEPFWAGFEAWSEGQRVEAIAPVMNKVRPFLLRSDLRTVLGQAEPRFDLRQVFAQRKVLLVNLAKGVMGSEAAALLGSLVVARLWQAALERSRIAPDRRHPVFVHIDEFQDYLHLPTDLADALAAARGLGVGLTLAHQHLRQLSPEMRSAVLANARSRVCFQLAVEDAQVIAGGSSLDADDLCNLDAFEVYAQLVAGRAVQPWLSARSRPAQPATSTPSDVICRSRENYGRLRSEIDKAVDAMRSPVSARGDIGVRRQRGGAT